MQLQQQQQRAMYLQNAVQTASPQQLLIMLYDGAIRNCRQAIEAIRGNRPSEAHEALVKAQNIISEFMITLDRTSSVAEGLLKLYEYFNSRLIEANFQKSTEPVEEVLGYLTELKETWIQAAKQYNQIASQVNGTAYKATQPTVV